MASDPENPAVVLLSGGMDSSVLLHFVAEHLQASPLYALSFDYGQRHSRELDCAKAQAVSVGVAAHQVIDFGFLGPLLSGASTLIEGGAAVPAMAELDAETLRHPPTYVPHRNMILLSLSAAYAEAQGARAVFYGAQAQDDYGYWDCTPAFLQRFNHILALNRGQPVAVHAPFIDKSKADIVTLGQELGVDFGQTWSCYRGEGAPCGECPTCVDRARAFATAGHPDPLQANPS